MFNHVITGTPFPIVLMEVVSGRPNLNLRARSFHKTPFSPRSALCVRNINFNGIFAQNISLQCVFCNLPQNISSRLIPSLSGGASADISHTPQRILIKSPSRRKFQLTSDSFISRISRGASLYMH